MDIESKVPHGGFSKSTTSTTFTSLQKVSLAFNSGCHITTAMTAKSRDCGSKRWYQTVSYEIVTADYAAYGAIEDSVSSLWQWTLTRDIGAGLWQWTLIRDIGAGLWQWAVVATIQVKIVLGRVVVVCAALVRADGCIGSNRWQGTLSDLLCSLVRERSSKKRFTLKEHIRKKRLDLVVSMLFCRQTNRDWHQKQQH